MNVLRKGLDQTFGKVFEKIKNKWVALDDNPEWMVSREEWGAEAPKEETDVMAGAEPLDQPVSYVVIHDTAKFDDPGDDSDKIKQVLREMQGDNMAEDCSHEYDIVYNFMVGGDGKVYVGRGWYERGAHTYKYNDKSIGLALIGNHKVKPPTGAILQATVRLIEWGMERRYLKGDVKVVPHSSVVTGARCPSKHLREAVERGVLNPDPGVAEWAWLWTVKRWLNQLPEAVKNHIRGQIDYWIDEWKICSTRQWFWYMWNN